MASQPAAATAAGAMKPSFAKVAASSYTPQSEKDKNPNTQPSNNEPPANERNGPLVVSSAPAPPTEHTVPPETAPIERQAAGKAPSNSQMRPAPPVVLLRNSSQSAGPLLMEVKGGAPAVQRPSEPSSLSQQREDGTQMSSDGSHKQRSTDAKSVASGTTFQMDEKESLRPDDSASARAVDEEEVSSAPGSIVASSRVPSDLGGRNTFCEQLHQVTTMVQQPPRGPVNGVQAPPVLMPPNVGPIPHAPAAAPAMMMRGGPMMGGMPQTQPVPRPDDKLLEALGSPTDRLWVLKLEQDMIDFIKDNKQFQLNLPACNSFYRMLAHRLADYYYLAHDVAHDVDSASSAVRVQKTAFCRMYVKLRRSDEKLTIDSPPPLSGINNSAATTPPPAAPVRRIMRRGDDPKNTSASSTAANSEGASKVPSEAGDSDGDKNKSRGKETREEKEARYKAAKERIWAESKNNTAEEPIKSPTPDGNDASRCSSASGKKKKKKQSKNDDEDFEARSQFNAYFQPTYAHPGYSVDPAYYNAYTGMMSGAQYPAMGSNGAPMMYNGSFSPMHQEAPQFPWAAQGYAPSSGMNGYNGASTAGYDLSADFQRAMSMHGGVSTPQTPAKSPALSNYAEPYQTPTQQYSQVWPQVSYDGAYQMSSPQMSQPSYPSQTMQTPTMGQSTVSYPYGQLPSNCFQNGPPGRLQHPIPGSFPSRQPFNPQTKAFVPGGRAASFSSQQSFSQMTSNGHNFGQQQRSTSSPLHSASATVGSPRPPPSVQRQNSQDTYPLPQQPSSIAKWGTPSHLPPKPPPPETMQPERFLETHRAMPHVFNTPGMPSSGSMGFGQSQVMVAANGSPGEGRNGSGSSSRTK